MLLVTKIWEQRKLGEIGKIIAGGDKDSKKLRKKGKYPVLANNLENNGIIGYYKNNYKIEAPAITVTARGNIGNAIARFTNFTPVVRLLVLKTNLDVKFIEQSINNINFFIESTGVPQLTVPQLASYSIFIPKKFEQHKIGNLFKFIDNIVALYERKFKLLSRVKKYFLDNLFAEKEYPNLRFKGFTDAWEQRKIKDYASYRRGSFPQPYGKKEWYDGKDSMPFVQVVDVKENLRLVDHTKQRISKLAQPQSVFVPTGKVLVTVQGSIGRVAITQYPSYIDRTLIVFEKYDTRTDKYFWAYTLQRKFDIEKRKAPGGTIKTITKKALSEFIVTITNYEEQNRLGIFFLKIDKLLALYENKQQHLTEIKKTLLNTMFI